MSHRQPVAAFTLIELLVVISIIAVLAGMLLPAVTMVRSAALKASCGSTHRQLLMAMTAYADDWDGIILPYKDGNSMPVYRTLSDLEYLPVNFGARCAAARSKTDTDFCNEVTIGVNVQFPPNTNVGLSNPYTFSQVGRKAIRGYTGCTSGIVTYGVYGCVGWYTRDHLGYRHAKTCNIGYLDGHVGSVRYADLSTGSAYNSDPFFLPWVR